MIKRTTLVLLCCCLAFATAIAQADDANCVAFREGTFAYQNESAEVIHIKRSVKKQEEVNMKTGAVTKFKIKWLTDCSYEIRQVWSSNKKQRKQNRAVTIVLMTNITKEKYDYTCKCKDSDERNKNSGTVVLLTN